MQLWSKKSLKIILTCTSISPGLYKQETKETDASCVPVLDLAKRLNSEGLAKTLGVIYCID